jgi:predicted nucleotidyltransferase
MGYNYLMKSIKAIDDKDLSDILLDVKKEIRQIFGNKLRQLVLYGSYARNESAPESDIDIMIMVDESEEGLKFMEKRRLDLSAKMQFENAGKFIKRIEEYIDIFLKDIKEIKG